MVVCRFFQQGRCKFGERCRDEHPGRNTAGSNSRNPFAPLQNASGRPHDSTGRNSNAGIGEEYKLDKNIISKDLTDDRPQYILSSYGPGKDAPLQLFGGHPREQSFEELRTRHYELTSKGKEQEAIQEAQALVNNAEQQMKIALNDLEGAIKYICDGEKEHPNRIDICKAKGKISTLSQPQVNGTSQPAFGQSSDAPAFGQLEPRTTFGQTSSTPAFGQPSGSSTFGKPSTLAFGQPSAPASAFGQVTRPASDRFSTATFGQPSVLAPAFGQTSGPAFGQPATIGRPATSFGQTSSTFGQPSVQAPTFGQPSSQPSAFANSSVGASTFGQPSTPSPFGEAQKSQAFGTSHSARFGQNVDQSNGSAFLAPSASSFGQPPATKAEASSIQTSTPPSNAFGTATPPSTGGTFGRPSTISQSPFAQPPAQQQSNPSAKPAINPTADIAPSAGANTARRLSINLPENNVATKDAQGNLRTWKKKEVRLIDDNWYYREDSQSEWERIWFPNGPPTFTKTEELPESSYDAATKEKYLFALEHGKFGDGGIPLAPPRKEWCNWNI